MLLLCYCGLAWLADSCETMLLSFLGPAVHCAWGVQPAAESLLTSVVSLLLGGLRQGPVQVARAGPQSSDPGTTPCDQVFVGMLLGVYSLGIASDYLGRRRGFLVSALLLGAAGLASAFAPSFGVSHACWLCALAVCFNAGAACPSEEGGHA